MGFSPTSSPRAIKKAGICAIGENTRTIYCQLLAKCNRKTAQNEQHKFIKFLFRNLFYRQFVSSRHFSINATNKMMLHCIFCFADRFFFFFVEVTQITTDKIPNAINERSEGKMKKSIAISKRKKSYSLQRNKSDTHDSTEIMQKSWSYWNFNVYFSSSTMNLETKTDNHVFRPIYVTL